MRSLALALLALAVLLEPGCGMLDAQLEARTACFTVAGAPIPPAGASGTVVANLDYDLGASLPALAQPGMTSRLTFQELELSPGPGSSVADLAGVEVLDASVLPPAGSGLPEQPLVHYLRPAGPTPSVISAEAEQPLDLLPYLAGGRVTLRAQARGALPAHAWTADARACFLLEVDVQVGKSQ